MEAFSVEHKWCLVYCEQLHTIKQNSSYIQKLYLYSVDKNMYPGPVPTELTVWV